MISRAVIDKAPDGDRVKIRCTFYGDAPRPPASKRDDQGVVHVAGAVIDASEEHEAEVVEQLRRGCELLGISAEVPE